MAKRKVAVVLFNLGGPDGPAAVRPFLFNLFRDGAIIGAPAAVRYPLAALISGLRAAAARANYAKMGGGSPLLPQTRRQAEALEAALNAQGEDEARVFVAMRYWHPLSGETARAVAAFAPDEIVLLPLYPQFSATTTASSLKAWARASTSKAPVRAVCCYPDMDALAGAHAARIEAAYQAAGRPEGVRLLFSAHGLPEKAIEGGDPYQAQIEATAAAIAARLPELADWRVCYQSRVGRLQWLEPSTDAEIRLGGREGRGVLIAPIAFVSEHVETLVELDRDYAGLAREAGCAPYLRARTPGVTEVFIDSLARAVLQSLERASDAAPHGPWRCPAGLTKCALRMGKAA